MRKNEPRVEFIRGRSLAKTGPHGNEEENDGSGIQQAAGLIRYFDEESEESWKITPRKFTLRILLGGFFYLVNQGVVQAIWNLF